MPLASWDRALECTRAALERKAYDLVVLETTKLTSIGLLRHLQRAIHTQV
jgi:hypothetical protein